MKMRDIFSICIVLVKFVVNDDSNGQRRREESSIYNV